MILFCAFLMLVDDHLTSFLSFALYFLSTLLLFGIILSVLWFLYDSSYLCMLCPFNRFQLPIIMYVCLFSSSFIYYIRLWLALYFAFFHHILLLFSKLMVVVCFVVLTFNAIWNITQTWGHLQFHWIYLFYLYIAMSIIKGMF